MMIMIHGCDAGASQELLYDKERWERRLGERVAMLWAVSCCSTTGGRRGTEP
jgi:hypothetical protein